MTPAQQQAAASAGQQALSGLQQAADALANSQIPQARQGLSSAMRGAQAQQQLYRDLARDNVTQPGGAPPGPPSGSQSPSPSSQTSQGGGGMTIARGGGGSGLRQGLGGAQSGWKPPTAVSEQEWDKVGERLGDQSKQVRGYSIPPYFRTRIKAYFDRIAEERRKAQSK